MNLILYFRDSELELFKGAHKSTLAYKIYLKRNSSNPCFWLDKSAQMGDMLIKKNPDKLFWLGVDAAAAFGFKIVQV